MKDVDHLTASIMPRRGNTLTVKDIQQDYGVGRSLALKIAGLLPHATTGKGLLVLRSDLDRFMERAVQNGANLWDVVREHNQETILGWLRG